jgi:hypothetical protein
MRAPVLSLAYSLAKKGRDVNSPETSESGTMKKLIPPKTINIIRICILYR